MFTPIVLLTLLLTPYFITNTATNKKEYLNYAGMTGMALVFLTAGVGHFVKTDQMTQLLPVWFPFARECILLTGVVEIVLGLGLFFKKYRRRIGIIIIILLVLFLFVNINAAYNKVEYGGHSWGLYYLFIRVPLQLVFILWTYWFCVRKRDYVVY